MMCVEREYPSKDGTRRRTNTLTLGTRGLKAASLILTDIGAR